VVEGNDGAASWLRKSAVFTADDMHGKQRFLRRYENGALQRRSGPQEESSNKYRLETGAGAKGRREGVRDQQLQDMKQAQSAREGAK
jgi:hypothetical protein